MNYFNPYYASYPTLTRPSLIKNLFGNINFIAESNHLVAPGVVLYMKVSNIMLGEFFP